MIPFGDKTVTLLHRENDAYVRYTLTGCSWRMEEVRVLEDNNTVVRVETTCRTPHNQKPPMVGDLLILGDVDVAAGTEIAIVRLLEALRTAGKAAFRVQRVRNNTIGGPLPHYAAIGE